MSGYIDIKTAAGAVLMSVAYSSESAYVRELMGAHHVSVVFDYNERVAIPANSYIEYDGRRWRVLSEYTPQLSGGKWRYDVHFSAPEMEFAHVQALYRGVSGAPELRWTMTGTPDMFVPILQRSLNATFGAGIWTIETQDVTKTPKTVELEELNMFDALTLIAEAFEMEWWVSGNRITIGKMDGGTEVNVRLGEITNSFDFEGDEPARITRLYAFGSTRNLPPDYGGGAVVGNIAERRLHLPNSAPFVSSGASGDNVVEAVQVFDDVYPKHVSVATDVRSKIVPVDNGSGGSVELPIYMVKENVVSWDYDHLLDGQTMRVHFETGLLAGMDFDIEVPNNAEDASGLVAKLVQNTNTLTSMVVGRVSTLGESAIDKMAVIKSAYEHISFGAYDETAESSVYKLIEVGERLVPDSIELADARRFMEKVFRLVKNYWNTTPYIPPSQGGGSTTVGTDADQENYMYASHLASQGADRVAAVSDMINGFLETERNKMVTASAEVVELYNADNHNYTQQRIIIRSGSEKFLGLVEVTNETGVLGLNVDYADFYGRLLKALSSEVLGVPKWFVRVVPNDVYGQRLPNATMRPVVGDKYVVYNYNPAKVSDVLVPAAEAELLKAAKKWLSDENQDRREVDFDTNAYYCEEHNILLALGQNVRLEDAIVGGYKTGRIVKFERRLYAASVASYRVGDGKSYRGMHALLHSVPASPLGSLNSLSVLTNEYSVVVESSNGTTTVGLGWSSTLTARFYTKFGIEKYADRCIWTRDSGDKDADATWNSKAPSGRTVVIRRGDVVSKGRSVRFYCRGFFGSEATGMGEIAISPVAAFVSEISAGVLSEAVGHTNLTASQLTLNASQQFLLSHASQIAQLNKQEEALREHVSEEFKVLMLGFRGKVNAAMTALKALLQDKKWDDVAVQEKVTELKTMLGHYAESIALSQKSLTDRVNADAIAGLQNILNQANQHANQLSASTLALAQQHTNTAIAPINQSLIEQAAKIADMQKQIDGEVSHFNGEYIPTADTYPANEWTSTEDKKRHINDTFTDLRPKANGTQAGYSWKWIEESAGVFKWVIIADGNEAALLAQIAALQGAVDGKITHYLSKPTAYSKGDFWTLEQDFTVGNTVWKRSSVITATTASTTFNWAHWRNPRYISKDDLEVGGVNLLKGSKSIDNIQALRVFHLSRIIPEGTTVTVSIGSLETTATTDKSLILFYKEDSSTYASSFLLFNNSNRTITTILTKDAAIVKVFSGDNYNSSQGKISSWKEVKIEIGNVATAWSPAPEDVEAATQLSISSASMSSKNVAKAAALIDAIQKERKRIEGEYLKVNEICPKSLTQSLFNTFTTYKGAEETLRNACISFIQGTNQSDSQYDNLIGNATTGAKPHKLYTDALEAFTRVKTEADRAKDGGSVRYNLIKKGDVPITIVGDNSTPYMVKSWMLDEWLIGNNGSSDKFYTIVADFDYTPAAESAIISFFIGGNYSAGWTNASNSGIYISKFNLKNGDIVFNDLRLYVRVGGNAGGAFGTINIRWIALYEGNITNPPLTYMPSKEFGIAKQVRPNLAEWALNKSHDNNGSYAGSSVEYKEKSIKFTLTTNSMISRYGVEQLQVNPNAYYVYSFKLVDSSKPITTVPAEQVTEILEGKTGLWGTLDGVTFFSYSRSNSTAKIRPFNFICGFEGGGVSGDWVEVTDWKVEGADWGSLLPTAYLPHPKDLPPKLVWQGTSLKIDNQPAVELKGQKGDTGQDGHTPIVSLSPETFKLTVDGVEVGTSLQGPQGPQGETGTFSPEQSQALVDHGIAIAAHQTAIDEHAQDITQLVQNFGVYQPSIDITTQTQYFQVLDEIRAAALAKSGPVCSTIRLKSAELPLILPCPQALGGREITIVRMANPLTQCYTWTDALYIRTPLSSSSVGILVPGSRPFNNFYYTSSSSVATQYTGCKAFKLSPETTDMFTALRNIDCSQSFTLTFRSVRDGNVDKWLPMNVANLGAVISPTDARRWEAASKQVNGNADWTAKVNGLILPRSYITTSPFTVTQSMGWIEFNRTGLTSSIMNIPTTLPSGLMFYVQNNSQGAITVTGCTVATGQTAVPPRSLCMVRKEGSSVLIFYMASLDTGRV